RRVVGVGLRLVKVNMYVRSYVGFFFSSRRRHTRLQGDWSSDVCSSDLTLVAHLEGGLPVSLHWNPDASASTGEVAVPSDLPPGRSEERRVGKECSIGGGS